MTSKSLLDGDGGESLPAVHVNRTHIRYGETMSMISLGELISDNAPTQWRFRCLIPTSNLMNIVNSITNLHTQNQKKEVPTEEKSRRKAKK